MLTKICTIQQVTLIRSDKLIDTSELFIVRELLCQVNDENGKDERACVFLLF